MKFEAGQVWEWSDSKRLYALLQQDIEPFVAICHTDQECWYALRLEDGRVERVIMHSETFINGEHWVRHF